MRPRAPLCTCALSRRAAYTSLQSYFFSGRTFVSPARAGALQSVEGGVEIVQDIPVRVLGAVEMERYKEPELGPVTVRMHERGRERGIERLASVAVERLRAMEISRGARARYAV